MTITEQLAVVRRRGWTVLEFERLDELGFFAPDERLELLEGEIVFKMGHNEPHAVTITLLQIVLASVFGPNFIVRTQLPIVLSDRNRPEPDLAIVSGAPRDYLQSHPMTALLVVEVSDSTLRQDQEVKAALYARAGIAEYWIVNLVEQRLEVHRDPAQMDERTLGHGYRSVQHLDVGQSIAPLAVPAASLAVADLLP